MKILIANRGEIASKIARTLSKHSITSVGIAAKGDTAHLADMAELIQSNDPSIQAYLDPHAIIQAAKTTGCQAIHPGYGFLSEQASFSKLCEQEGIQFIGPTEQQLEQLGDKMSALKLATEHRIPTLARSSVLASVEQASTFYSEQSGPFLLKATCGGGGRGIRLIEDIQSLEKQWQACQREVGQNFADSHMYLEAYLPQANHIEIQVVGDGKGGVKAWAERDCSIQRMRQKMVEITPSLLKADLIALLEQSAVTMAKAVKLRGLCTFEFLVDQQAKSPEAWYFMECNPRIQVEHTITEQRFGIDLVSEQLKVCIPELSQISTKLTSQLPNTENSGSLHSLQLRLYAEQWNEQGQIIPASGTPISLEFPQASCIEQTSVQAAVNPDFDALIAKLVYTANSRQELLSKAAQDLAGIDSLGMPSNLPVIKFCVQQLQTNPQAIHTEWLMPSWKQDGHAFLMPQSSQQASVSQEDPLAVLAHAHSHKPSSPSTALSSTPAAGFPDAIDAGTNDGQQVFCLDFRGKVISWEVKAGDEVDSQQPVAIVEAMKMEHEIKLPCQASITELAVQAGQIIEAGQRLLTYRALSANQAAYRAFEPVADPDRIRADLKEVLDRRAKHLDVNRPSAVAKRRKTGHRTVRENIQDLCDAGTFREYGDFAVAAQRKRRDLQDLIDRTPGDGMVCGVGEVNGEQVGKQQAKCVLVSYDYTVLAGTQGKMNHEKKDRMFALARDQRLPVILFAEGGGGRPGDVDVPGVAGLDCMAFRLFGELNGKVPLIGIVTGRCFAGNAALLGCCDVIIATQDANIGMGGPAMIEGGGLGVYRPEEVGPVEVQRANGVVDIVVQDELQAIEVAKDYLRYFQGDQKSFEKQDQRQLRFVIPENRLRVYEVRHAIELMADRGSVLELRQGFGQGIVTSLARIEGMPVGVLASDTQHGSGAIQSDDADKAARFMQLCQAHGLPIVSLIDTPGIMVGPQAEETALVRHAARLFVNAAHLTVPLMAVVLRKAYGLGAQALAAGGFKSTLFSISWPTGEFGGMGLEGATKLAYRKELEALESIPARKELYDKLVAEAYQRGKAINMASFLEIDTVIDPAETRDWIASGVRWSRDNPSDAANQPSVIDTW